MSITKLDFWMNFEIKLLLKLTLSCPKWDKARYSETYLDFTTWSQDFWKGVQKNHLQILGGVVVLAGIDSVKFSLTDIMPGLR